MIVTGARVGHWVAERTGGKYWPEMSAAMGWERDGRLTAGVWYENWNRATVICHIAIEAPLTKTYLKAIFRYPFEHVAKIIAPVKSTNARSIRLVEKMGFVREAIIAEGYEGCDMFIYTLRRERCRYLGDCLGQRQRTATPT